MASTPLDWAAVLLLAICAAIAHRFPISSASSSSSIRLTPIFVVAGSAILPIGLLTPLALLTIAPDLWFRRHRPRVLVGWVFNAAQSAVGAHAAALIIATFGRPGQLESVTDLAVLLAAAATFMLLQEVLVAVVVAIDTRTPLTRSSLFTQPALLSNALLSVLAVSVSSLWLARPMLLLLVIPVLGLAHRLTRTAHLAHLAEVDVKTGVHNSAHFERTLDRELERHRRLNRPLAVIFADLDHFKRINDEWGHAGGDRVLRVIADRLVAHARRGDLVARFGGEEFVLLLPTTDHDEAIYVAERIRAAIADEPVTLETGAMVRCTASFGVAICPDHASDAAGLLRQADRAMYAAKSTRNAVTCASGRAIPAGTSTPERADEPANPTPTPATHDATRSAGRRTWAQSLSIWGPVALGALVVLASLARVVESGDWTTLLLLIGLVTAGEMLSVRVQDVEGQSISFSFAVVVAMAAVVALPAGAPLVNAAGAIVHVIRARQRNRAKLLFNTFSPPLATAGAVIAYWMTQPYDPIPDTPMLAAMTAASVYFAINMGTIAFAVSVHTGRSFADVLGDAAWFTPTKIFFGLTGAFLGAVFGRLGLAGSAMFVAPLLILRFTMAFYASRSKRALDKLRLLNIQLTSEIARRQQSELSLAHQAKHDALTDLPNRELLRERLAAALARTPISLLLLDLDRFKEINDTFGHLHGDRLLQTIGARLSAALVSEHLIARLGGDEFAIVLYGADLAAAETAADALLQALREPFRVNDYPVHVAASVGIVVAPRHGTEADELLRHADVAMYRAKETRRSPVIYDPSHDQYSPRKLALVGELQQAIQDYTLDLYYQPKIALDSGRLVGVEALARWTHAEHGMLGPDMFVPLAERSGLIGQLTAWVVETAVRQAREWLDIGHAIPVAINVSAHDLQDAVLVDRVEDALRRHAVAPRLLRVEVTEGAMMADVDSARQVLTRLRALGVHASIDDFGTGYASLTYLKQMPVDEIKLDRSFVLEMIANPVDAAIVTSTIDLAHRIGMTVIAEGIEDIATHAQLRALGCDDGQGYYWTAAVPGSQIVPWLMARSEATHGRAA